MQLLGLLNLRNVVLFVSPILAFRWHVVFVHVGQQNAGRYVS
jgi:hypothetical protein